MARLTEFQPLYDAFHLFQERCLLNNSSMLWPDKLIWTVGNLQLWKKLFIDAPIITEKLSFSEKLERQLASGPQILWGLVADLHYVYYLPSSSLLIETRMQNLTWAAEKGGLALPLPDDPVWLPFKHGFTRTTQKYHFRFAQLMLLSSFALYLKELGDTEHILLEVGRVQRVLDDILDNIPNKRDRAYDLRHAILYLMFPDRYERIISTGDKEKIAQFYGHLISTPDKDLDTRLWQIRQVLTSTKPKGTAYDYYSDLKQEWNPNEVESSPAAGTVINPIHPKEDPVIVRDALRLLKRFTNIILYGPPGTGKTYWAREIASRCVSPQLTQAQSTSAFLPTTIEGLTFYDVLALSMCQVGRDRSYSVAQLEVLELVQARFRTNPVMFPSNHIWGYLQSHTSPESRTVRVSPRAEPYLFDKAPNSLWFLTPAGQEYVQNTLGERLELIKQGPPSTNQPKDFISWVTFHQSYAYEDFVEGLRPRTEMNDTGPLAFELKPGVFRRLCLRATDDPHNQYVLVIDEINRGNIAKVFGELMTLIEADKRGVIQVELPYSKEVFQVPSNLAIIGTMNTADRSIALLDVALRRRFAFIELLPEPELLDNTTISQSGDELNLGTCLRRLNHQIRELRGADYQIGHSYFLCLRDIDSNQMKLELLDDVWNYQVVPLLKEYFYGQGDLLRQVLPGFFDQDGDQTTSAVLLQLHGEDLVAALNRL